MEINMNSEIPEICEKEFEKIVHNEMKGVACIDFFAEWCMPCLMMSPILEDLAQNMKKHIQFAKVNISECSSLAEKFGVSSIPTFIVFKNGKEVDRIVGQQPADIIEEKLMGLCG